MYNVYLFFKINIFFFLCNCWKQLNFFRKGLKVLEAVEPSIRNVAEKHRIDYQMTGGEGEGEPMSGGYESTDDGELSFDYNKQKKQLLDDDDGSSPNPMEVFYYYYFLSLN